MCKIVWFVIAILQESRQCTLFCMHSSCRQYTKGGSWGGRWAGAGTSTLQPAQRWLPRPAQLKSKTLIPRQLAAPGAARSVLKGRSTGIPQWRAPTLGLCFGFERIIHTEPPNADYFVLCEGQGVPFKQYLTGSKIYSCSYCRCHAADSADVESKVLPHAARTLPSGACCGAGYSRC